MNSEQLAACLKNGEAALVATDTVYGLAALPGSEGYRRIFELKGRSEDQVLPWLVGSPADLNAFGTELTPAAHRLASMFWPGALTLVVKASDAAKELGGVAGDGTVALRMPDDAECLHLLKDLDAPLACTSANLHGEPAPVAFDQIDSRFLDLACSDCIKHACDGGVSSTIVDCTAEIPKILREGAISAQLALTVACLDDTLLT